MGGLHLSGATENVIPETVADLQRFGLKLLPGAFVVDRVTQRS
jgi:hypothetical protein